MCPCAFILIKSQSHGQQVPVNAVNGLIFLFFFPSQGFSAALETSPNLMHFSHVPRVAGKLKKKNKDFKMSSIAMKLDLAGDKSF